MSTLTTSVTLRSNGTKPNNDFCELSLTRQAHGEHTYWAAIAASLLGQIGLPAVESDGTSQNIASAMISTVSLQLRFRREKRVNSSIPVARVADMLLEPGTQFDFNGKRQTYPDIRVVYWAGGVFHHHQDLNRLLRREKARHDHCE